MQTKEREFNLDSETIERLRRAACQEADGLKRQLDGKRQYIRVLETLGKQAREQAET